MSDYYTAIVKLMEENEELQGVVTSVELPTVDMIEVPESNGNYVNLYNDLVNDYMHRWSQVVWTNHVSTVLLTKQ